MSLKYYVYKVHSAWHTIGLQKWQLLIVCVWVYKIVCIHINKYIHITYIYKVSLVYLIYSFYILWQKREEKHSGVGFGFIEGD